MDRLTIKIEGTQEKDIQLKTKGVFRPVTRQIGNSIGDIQDYYKEKRQDGVTVVPSDCPPHLKHIKEALLHHLQPVSFLFQKNLVTGTEAAGPLLVLMDSLALAMDLEVVARPSEVICDVLLAICNQPVFVLTLVESNTNSDKLKEYNNSVATGVTGKLKTFMDERVCVVSGVCCMDDIKEADTFCGALKDHARLSSFFIPLKTFETPLPKFENIVMAFWASVAETKAVIACDMDKNEELKRFLTKDQCVILLENINKRKVKVQHKPGSGATTLMVEVARRLSRLNDTILVCSISEEKARLSSLYPKILTSEEFKEENLQTSGNIVVEKDAWKFQVTNQQGCWKFVLLNEEEVVSNEQSEACEVQHEDNVPQVKSAWAGKVVDNERQHQGMFDPRNNGANAKQHEEDPRQPLIDMKHVGDANVHETVKSAWAGKVVDNERQHQDDMSKTSTDIYSSSTSQDFRQCDTCFHLNDGSLHLGYFFTIHLKETLFDKLEGGKKRQFQRRPQKEKFKQTLQKYVAALMNTGGGCILIHIDGLKEVDRSLRLLDQCMTPWLKDLIPDGSMYLDNYKRMWLSNCEQSPLKRYTDVILLRVKGSRYLVTVDFNSKIRNDHEMVNATASNIVSFLLREKYMESSTPFLRFTYDMSQTKERYLEVKSLSKHLDKTLEAISGNLELLTEHIWHKLKLKDNISAMSKVEGGGSYILGVGEGREDETQRMIIQGIHVDVEPDALKQALYQKIVSNVLVLEDNIFFTLNDHLISIKVHTTIYGFVLEVAIGFCKGLVFSDSKGPRTYEVREQKVFRITKEAWLDRMMKRCFMCNREYQ